jgi:tetratricopeptide (TPR) repeat protein
MAYLTTESRARLRDTLAQAFDLAELRLICSDLGLDWEDIPGDTKTAKAFMLLLTLERSGRASDLLTHCGTARPQLDWTAEWTDVKPKELDAPFKLTRRMTQALIALGCVSVIGIGLALTRLFAPQPAGPMRMGLRGSTFNIAVAQFAQAEPGGQLKANQDGATQSERVFRALTNERERYKEINPDAVIDIWHDSLPTTEKGAQIGYIGQTLADQEAAVIAATRAISADLMIYGAIDVGGLLRPSFYVPPTFKGAVEYMGRYRLGDEAIASSSTPEDLTTRTNALFWMSRGLDYDGQGQQAKALEAFRQAEKKFENWAGQAHGAEILYFFIGQAELFLAQKVEARTDEAYARTVAAETAFSKSLSIAPGYLRAHIGLSSVHVLRAQWELRDGALTTPALLTSVRAHLGGAERVAPMSGDPLWSKGVLHLALGGEQFLLGRVAQIEGRDADAEAAFARAIQRFAQSREVFESERAFRLTGQLYQNIGAAYGAKAVVQKNLALPARARESYAGALEAFDQCVAQGAAQPDDKTLTGLIVATCERQRALAQQKLSELK